ncbi:YggT family protein [Thiomicrospira microaerophila]|uniref:YggT family protein n=1 Tax=Thiomicrospira microaerophila TaxID=406020 RepID=UPI0020106256|nr:YggT family protein [Thiomicrospira microaerophila]UQB41726.1 YggT family protein [Thiomicrospira microaerophila]
MGSPIGQAGLFLLQFIAGLVIFVLVLRFLIRATHTDWRNQIVMFIAKVTNPVCKPFAMVIPSKGRWDWAALAAAFSVQVLFVILIGWLTNRDFGLALILLSALTEVLNVLLDMIFWLIIIQVILSWLVQSHNPNLDIFRQLTAPILAPFQRLIPPLGGFDLSPIIAILAIKLSQILIVGSIAQFAQTMV